MPLALPHPRSTGIRLLAIWRLLSLRVERTSLAEPGLACVLSSMWASSCLLSATIGSGASPNSFRLAGAMGMTACAAWSREVGVIASVSPAQRRVLVALHALPGGGWPAATARLNVLVGELISVPVLVEGPRGRTAAILLHEPQEVFRNSCSGTPRGSAAAREQMLQVCGWLFVGGGCKGEGAQWQAVSTSSCYLPGALPDFPEQGTDHHSCSPPSWPTLILHPGCRSARGAAG